MRITTLIENTTECGMPVEHGLSLYIETERHTLLFDMGQTSLFAENAERLGIDLRKVDLAILSHGHYDHGGGLRRFLEVNDRAPVYLHRFAFEPHYNGTEKYIGLDVSLQSSDRLIFTEGVTKIDSGITLYDCNDRQQRWDFGSGGLNMEQDGRFVPDDFRHEQVLLLEEKGKRVLISGCSHKGILNIAEWFRPDVLIGGFHFSKLPLDETLQSYAEEMSRYPTTYYTCHCTGVEQYRFMKRFVKDLQYLSTGKTIVL